MKNTLIGEDYQQALKDPPLPERINKRMNTIAAWMCGILVLLALGYAWCWIALNS